MVWKNLNLHPPPGPLLETMRGLLHLSPGAKCSLSSYHNSAASEMLECQPEMYGVYQVWAAQQEFICSVFFSSQNLGESGASSGMGCASQYKSF